jgi:hypothetical protein
MTEPMDDSAVQHADIPAPEDQPYAIADVYQAITAELAVARLKSAEDRARATHAHRLLAQEQSKVRVLTMENADLRDQLAHVLAQPNDSA